MILTLPLEKKSKSYGTYCGYEYWQNYTSPYNEAWAAWSRINISSIPNGSDVTNVDFKLNIRTNYFESGQNLTVYHRWMQNDPKTATNSDICIY